MSIISISQRGLYRPKKKKAKKHKKRQQPPVRIYYKPENYNDYLTSDTWLKRKISYFSKHKRMCVACKSNKNIHLHHKTYENIGQEKDYELVSLCEPCHQEVHDFYKSKPFISLSTSTNIFIERKRRLISVHKRDNLDTE